MTAPSLVAARSLLRDQLAAVRRARSEILITAMLAGGWSLTTLAFARLWRADVVWPLSAGLALLALCGRDVLVPLVRDGLYFLTREDSNG